MNLKEIDEKLKKSLRSDRYLHSLSVAKTACRLAEIFGADRDKAYLAGILHDCAKNYSKEELFKLADEFSLEIDKISSESWGLIHGFVGAELAKSGYGVYDDEIYDAIYYHTIGKADMPLLTEIIYLADGIEPLRDYPGVEQIRITAEKDLHRAVLMYTDMTIGYVIKRGLLLHPSAVETRNFYLEKTKDI